MKLSSLFERTGHGGMTTRPSARLTRRHVLRGACGAALALPFIEAFAPKRASAADGGYTPYAIFMRQANGVAQEVDGEPERFFPNALGALTQAGLAEQTDRAVSLLADHADKLTILRGVNFAFPGNGCGHSGGGNQVLTAARVSDDPSGNASLAMGESIDNLIARTLHEPGVEPLTLYAGRMAGYIDEVLSYRGPMQLRAAERNPFNAYMDLFGLSTLPPEALEKLRLSRKSVNDLVRSQMTALLSRTDLSQRDRERLDLHFSAIRDLEVNMACELPQGDIDAMEAIQDGLGESDNVITITKMQMDIIALACACGVVRAATLQVGDGNDSTQYTIGGVKQYSYHWISHRIEGDGDTGAEIPNADVLHHEIDKIHADMFKHLLDRLASYTLGSGTLLDSGIAIWTNDLSNKYHSYSNVPFVCAGSCNDFLRTGQYIDAGGVDNNKLWNTVATAVGVRKDDGGYVDNFGDESLEPGLIDAMLA
jgi:hypothetical protein